MLDLLVYFCQLAIVQKPNTRQIPLSGEHLDWEVLLQLATRHRVRPLLYKGLLRWNNKAQIPIEVLAELKRFSFNLTIRNMDYTQELIKITQLFKEKNIEIIPYKGSVLAQEAYGCLGDREFSDIDFLFEQKHFNTIQTILENRAYQAEIVVPAGLSKKFFKYNCEYNFDFYKDNKRLYHVEPHWSIGQRMHQIALDYQDILPLTRVKNILGVSTRVLTPEGLLLTTCLHHGGKEQWLYLKHICDIAAILEQFGARMDWTKLFVFAKKYKVENLLLLGIGMTINTFSLQIPIEIQQQLKHKKFQKNIPKHIDRIERPIPQNASVRSVSERVFYHISLRAHWSTKFKVVYYHLLRLVSA